MALSRPCPWAHCLLQLAVLFRLHCVSHALGWPTVLEAELKTVGRAVAKVSLVGGAGRLHGKDEPGLLPNYPPVDF